MRAISASFVVLGGAVALSGLVAMERYLKHCELTSEHLIGFRVVIFLGSLLAASGLLLWRAS